MTRAKPARVHGDVIPAEAWAKSLHMMFGLVAMRRGPHWQLQRIPADRNPFGDGPIDEAMLLAEAIAGVAKYVPLPTTELGIAGAIGNLGVAVYMTVGSRVQVDQAIRAGKLAIAPDGSIVAVVPQTPPPRPAAQPTAPFMPDRPAEQTVTATHTPAARNTPPPTPAPAPAETPATTVELGEPNGGGDVAAQLEALGDTPLAAVTHMSGDPIDDGVQLGHAPTALLQPNEDPEPALLEAFRPGQKSVPIDVLAASNGTDTPLLDRLAPAPMVGDQTVSRELG